ncbi:hypothetical protein ACB092_11G004900 [Castanea dentata]
MSGAQGAQPPESKTATTYESISGGENKTKIEIRSKEDQGMIQIDKLQDKVQDAAGKGGPVSGADATKERVF